MFELVEPRERHPRRDARQAFTHKNHVRADAILGHDVRQPALVDVETLAVALEPDPPPQHQPRELVPRGIRKRRRGVEDTAEFRRVDTEQPHPPKPRHVDRVAVDDRAHQHEF